MNLFECDVYTINPTREKKSMADSTQISDLKFSALPAGTNLGAEEFLNRIIIPHPDVHCTVLDGEAVLLNLKNGHYYTLNRVGGCHSVP